MGSGGQYCRAVYSGDGCPHASASVIIMGAGAVVL